MKKLTKGLASSFKKGKLLFKTIFIIIYIFAFFFLMSLLMDLANAKDTLSNFTGIGGMIVLIIFFTTILFDICTVYLEDKK